LPVGAAVVGAAGAAWGLGFARLLAEAGFRSAFYTSALAVAATAGSCAALALVLWWLSFRDSSRTFAAIRQAWTSFLPLALPTLYALGVFSSPLAGAALVVGGAVLVPLVAWGDQPRWLLPVLLGSTSLFLYVVTLLPGIGEADTLEFQVVAAKLGVAHPTGYPLYILLGKLFTFLPVRTVAWRVNLSSAVFGAATVVTVYGVLRRLLVPWARRKIGGKGATSSELTGHESAYGELVAFLAALALAFSATFWSQAIIAEVYTLHNLLVALLLGLLLGSVEGPGRVDGTEVRRWYAICFLIGLSLTNHLTTALLIPAAALTLVLERPRWKPANWLIAGGLFLLGISVYLFIPLRWPALNDGQRMTVGAFVKYITGGQFHGALRLDGWQDPTRWQIVGRLLLRPFGWPGLALASVGVAHLALRRRRVLLLTAVTFFAFFLYGLDYYVADIAVFLLPAHLILAIWMGIGVDAIAGLLKAKAPTLSRIWGPLVVVLFALVPLGGLWTSLPAVNRNGDPDSLAWGRYALSQGLKPGGAVLADPKRFAPLYYLQQVEGVRTDLDVVLLGTEELYQAELRRRLAEGQPVYLARYLPDLGGLHLRSIGPLAEVADAASRMASSSESAALFGETVKLLGAEVEADPFGRPVRHVTLHWRAERAVEGDYVVRLRLVDSDGEERWATEGARPVNGLHPTNAWRPGVPISDYHKVEIPTWLPPGDYSIQVGLFSPFGTDGLPVGTDPRYWLPLNTVEVGPRSVSSPLPGSTKVAFEGGTWLTGSDVAEQAAAGAPFTVELGWRNVTEDVRVQLSWIDVGSGRGDGAGTGSLSFPLASGMVRSRHVVTAPLESGRYHLLVGLMDNSARCTWLAPATSGCAIAAVDIKPAQAGLANFGDRVLLTDAKLGKSKAVPGEHVPVALRWRGLRKMAEDYTVFVHLVGPDGRLHGQMDRWPVQGSYPTSEWKPGRGVMDDYAIRVEADAPPGRYRVEVGLYRLETMERLRVLNEMGEPVADSFMAGTFSVPD
jgi:hypothetical protein